MHDHYIGVSCKCDELRGALRVPVNHRNAGRPENLDGKLRRAACLRSRWRDSHDDNQRHDRNRSSQRLNDSLCLRVSVALQVQSAIIAPRA